MALLNKMSVLWISNSEIHDMTRKTNKEKQIRCKQVKQTNPTGNISSEDDYYKLLTDFFEVESWRDRR